MSDNTRLCFGCMETIGKDLDHCPVCSFCESEYNVSPRALPLHTMLNERYEIGKVLGEGGFGLTYIAFDHRNKIPVAIKEYFPTTAATRDCSGGELKLNFFNNKTERAYKGGLDKYSNEAEILKRFNNLDGIVSTLDFFKENNTGYIVMEYIDGITLKEYLESNGTISPKEAVELMMPVLKALETIHSEGIIHRDISPDNLMIRMDGAFKLIDFGAARISNDDNDKSLTIILKRGFAPEEQYRSKGKQGPWTDIYALCATMYKMITNRVPPEAMDRIIEDEIRPLYAYPIEMPESQMKAIMKGLNVRAKDRFQNVKELRLELDTQKQAKERNTHMIAVFKEKDNSIVGYRLYDIESNKINDISPEDLIKLITHKRLKVYNLIVYNHYIQPVGGSLDNYPVLDVLERLTKNDNYYFVEHSLSSGYKCLTHKGIRCYFNEIEMVDLMKQGHVSNPDTLELFLSKRNMIATNFNPAKKPTEAVPKARTVTEEIRRKEKDKKVPTKNKLSLKTNNKSLSNPSGNAENIPISTTQMRLKLLNSTHLTSIANDKK
ncbi:MAG: serine/threonine protein kinase [Lachnospiraceae bacterium]|nr:serine/threonine protein kinase [Lachnospiraceae bacterium]